MIDQQQQEEIDRLLKKSEGGEHYDAQGKRIINVGMPADDQDAMSKEAVYEYFRQLESGEIGDTTKVHTSTGVLALKDALDQRVIHLPSMSSLFALDTANFSSGQIFNVLGSVIRWAGEKLTPSSPIFARSFGAVPDTGFNLTTEINEALDYHSNHKVRLLFDAGDYVYDGIARTDSNYWIDIDTTGGKAVFKGTAALSSGGRIFKIESDVNDHVHLALGNDIAPGDDFIAVDSTANLEPGMVLQLSSTELWPYDNRGEYYKGETHLIESLPLDTRIEIEDTTRDIYVPEKIAQFIAWKPRHCVMRNITVDMREFGGDVGIQVNKCYRPIFENITCMGADTAGTWLLQHWSPYIRNYTAVNINNIASGYGIQDRGCVGTLIDGLYTKGCRRAFDAHSNSGLNSSPSRDYRVTNFVVNGGGIFWPNSTNENYGIGNHGESEGGEFSNGTIINCQYGINLRGAKQILSNINIYGKCKRPIDLTFG